MNLYWHFDETFYISRRLHFGLCASYTLALGNIDVDLRHWDEEHQHGMTKANESTGKAEETPEEAEKAWQKIIDDRRREAKKALSDGECCRALFLLGQALHSTQDREAHHGMTNPEHAVLELRGKSPDDNRAGHRKAKLRTREFLRDFLANLSREDREKLKNCPCDCIDGLPHGKYNIDLGGFKRIGLRFLLNKRKYDKIRWPESTPPKMAQEPKEQKPPTSEPY